VATNQATMVWTSQKTKFKECFSVKRAMFARQGISIFRIGQNAIWRARGLAPCTRKICTPNRSRLKMRRNAPCYQGFSEAVKTGTAAAECAGSDRWLEIGRCTDTAKNPSDKIATSSWFVLDGR